MIEIVGINHVQLSMPAGGEDRARAFYAGILGLGEVPQPAELAGWGGVWFAGGKAAIHLGPERDFRAMARAHPALVVADLAAARTHLARAGIPVEEDNSGLPVERCFVGDPFGNWIELVDARDAGFSLGRIAPGPSGP
jgi:catechol 2,3-dioxygenase-like lactoylglutathione lyase family enzyme